jgi:hypothetical protein
MAFRRSRLCVTPIPETLVVVQHTFRAEALFATRNYRERLARTSRMGAQSGLTTYLFLSQHGKHHLKSGRLGEVAIQG